MNRCINTYIVRSAGKKKKKKGSEYNGIHTEMDDEDKGMGVWELKKEEGMSIRELEEEKGIMGWGLVEEEEEGMSVWELKKDKGMRVWELNEEGEEEGKRYENK